MIIDNLDIVGLSPLPTKADPPLVVDANAVVPYPAPTKLLEAVPRRHSQVVQGGRGVQLHELAQRDSMHRVRQLPDGLAVVSERVPSSTRRDSYESLRDQGFGQLLHTAFIPASSVANGEWRMPA